MKRPNPWLLLFRVIACYWFAVGAWWFISMVNQSLIPTRQVVPFVDRAAWVERPAWWMGAGLAVLLVARVAYMAKRPGLHRYGTARWNRAFEAAGLIKDSAAKGAKPAPRAKMAGRVRVVDETTLCILCLPPGLAVPQVQAKVEQVAASLDVPVERLHLSKHEGRGSMLAVRVDPPTRELKPRGVLPESSSWRSPVLIGRSMRGRDVTAPTYDIGQWLVGGITGSGKTTLLRLLALHYALDPDAIIWGCDGKGSRDDWGPLRHRANRWVDVTDPDAAGLYLQMLRDIAAEVTDRNRAGGRDHPGMLVILEEATALRAALDPNDMKEADRHLVRIVQTCRSANVLVVTAAQRPSATLMSTNVRAQAGVGVCMKVRAMADAEMVLGYRPEIALPDAVGRALLDTGDGATKAVLVDYLPEQQWKDACHQWRPLRLVPAFVDEAEPEDEPEAKPEDAVFDDEPEPLEPQPLLVAVEIALRAAGRRMTTTELWDALPQDLRTINAATLGKALTAAGVRPVRSARGMLYSLDVLALAPAFLPASACRGGAGVEGS